MTGPEHYEQAERLLRASADADNAISEGALLAAAAVHARLALVAADVDIALGIRDASTATDWLTVRVKDRSPR